MLDTNNTRNVTRSATCDSDATYSGINSDARESPSVTRHSDEEMRRFLTYWIAFVMILILIIFVITRDGTVLAAGTIFAAAITTVFNYYFKKEDKHNAPDST